MGNVDNEGIKIKGRNINNIRYAYDAVLIADLVQKLKTWAQKVSEHGEVMGIKINRKKTKTMVVTKKIESP